MRFFTTLAAVCSGIAITASASVIDQLPILRHASTNRNVSAALFTELEELARIVDISYCVGLTSFGISKPFSCLSRCSDFPDFELVTTWNTGPMLSDSCGYIALDHGKRRIVVAFRGTYSVANTVVDLSTVPQEYVPYPGDEDEDDSAATPVGGKAMLHSVIARVIGGEPIKDTEKIKCDNCTVHMGFHTAWLHTKARILPDLLEQLLLFPDYELNLVGHSLGGAVAALAALEMNGRGFQPVVTTFGEPRIGNKALNAFLDKRFNLDHQNSADTKLRYRRITHVDDPVPLLPLSEWGFSMHSGEIFISKPALTPDITNLEHCVGATDQHCIAGQDSTTSDDASSSGVRKRDLLTSVEEEVHDVIHEPWGIPSRYKLWQLFFAHRDYFWRLGLCVPGGDPLGGGEKYDHDPKMELR